MEEKLTKEDIIAMQKLFMNSYERFASVYFFLLAIADIVDYLSISLKNLEISIIYGVTFMFIITVYVTVLIFKYSQFIRLRMLFFGHNKFKNYYITKIVIFIIYMIANSILPNYNLFLLEVTTMPLIPIIILLPSGSPATDKFNNMMYKLSLIYVLFSPVYYFTGISSFLVTSLLLFAGGIYVVVRQS